jgi:hypothetical protein
MVPYSFSRKEVHVKRFFVGILASLFCVNAADAHSVAPFFPVQHAFLKPLAGHALKPFAGHAGLFAAHSRAFFPASHAIGKSFDFTKPLGSTLTRSGLASIHPSLFLKTGGKPFTQLVSNAFNSGRMSAGGSVSGMLQGDLYVVNPTSPLPSFFNLGEYTGTIGTNLAATFPTSGVTLFGANSLTPGFQNTINFSAPSVGQQFLGFGRGSGIWRKAFELGQKSGLSTVSNSGSGVAGGLFVGGSYRNTFGSSTFTASTYNTFTSNPSNMYVFAFGNNPLNNPGAQGSFPTLIGQVPYVQFNSGLKQTISNGQILFPTVTGGGVFQNGTFFTMGSNPASSAPLGSVLHNLNSFLFF